MRDAFENGVEVVTTYIMGYGGPSVWPTRAIWQNKILEQRKSYSEFESGRTHEAYARTYGLRDVDSLQRMSEDKPIADRLCDHCKKPCRKPSGEPWAISRGDFVCCSSECLNAVAGNR